MQLNTPQTMHCIFDHSNPILNLNSKIQARKGLIIYNTTNSIATLREHVHANHSHVLKKIKEEMNCPLREEERQPSKKRPNISSSSISSFFLARELFQKKDMQQTFFWGRFEYFICQKPSSFPICGE
jgi:hypothetical protein